MSTKNQFILVVVRDEPSKQKSDVDMKVSLPLNAWIFGAVRY